MTSTTLRMDPLVPATEAEIVHGWVVEDRAEFWMMQEHTLEEVREIYQWIADQDTHAAYLVRRGDEPVALFQTYDPRAEEVGEHVDVLPGDLGVHFMLAPATVARPGFTLEVIAFLATSVFADPGVNRIVVEPDDRNEKAVARVRELGFELGPVVQLSTKPARLAYWTRDDYEKTFSKNSSA